MKQKIERKLVNFFTLYYLIFGEIVYVLGKMNSRFWTLVQNRRIRKYIKFAYSMPFYKNKFDEWGISTSEIQRREDLLKLPILTKDEYRKWIETETKNNPKRYKYYFENATSGSTGHPLKLYESVYGVASDIANLYRSAWIQDKKFHPMTDKTLHVYTRSSVRRASFVQKIGLFRSYKIGIQDGYDKCVSDFCKYKPDFVFGNKTSIISIFNYAKKMGIELPPIKVLASNGEMLDPASRECVNNMWNKTVLYDVFGSTETGNFAVERIGEEGKYIIWSDTHVVHVINGIQNADGSITGSIVITPLMHTGFPAINYLLEDSATLFEKSGYLYLKDIQGRNNDTVIGHSGKAYNGAVFMSIMNDIIRSNYMIKQYRIIQHEIGKLTWLLSVDEDEATKRVAILDILHNRIAHVLNSDFEIEFEWVEQLPPDANGKLRVLICECEKNDGVI